jgi:tRNA nucleotidyltransferase/poly(A) polymerase
VRDLLRGRPAGLDVDVVVEGDAGELARRAAPDSRVTVHARFGTATIAGDGAGAGGFRIDLARARRERYPRPGALPAVEPAAIEEDLSRRDFTVNAIAWGADGPPASVSTAPPVAALVDPFGGAADIERRVLRAVGDPDTRFREDALRMVRAVRLAATLGFTIEPDTWAALVRNAPLVEHLSGERVAAELEKLLDAPTPSVGLRLLADSGILAVIAPALDAQRGLPQNKIPGEDLWDHTLRTVDATPTSRPAVRLAALLHDIGKPATLDDGPFRGHEIIGAEQAAALLDRLRFPRAASTRVVELVRQHMFTYDPAWGDAGVRRFIQRVGRAALEDLFLLREADNIGSGVPGTAHGLDELRARVRAQLDAQVALDLRHLAINGDDLMTELGLPPGPRLGRILDGLLDRVVADPAVNDRAALLLLAESMLAEDA